VPKVTFREFLRSALTLRMVALFLGLVVVAGVCIRLGSWQLDRASERAEQKAAAEAAAEANMEPQPLNSVLKPGETFIGAAENQRITVTGEYEAADQVLVPNRILDGDSGFGVLTPLRVGDAVLPVLRGWIADPTEELDPPTGDVTIVGVLRPSEGMEPQQVPEGQVSRIASADLVNRWGGPIWTGYVLLEGSDPAQLPAADGGPHLLPLPEPEDAGLNLQNLAYAFEWWIFGGFFMMLWIRSVRDHARRRKEVAGGPSDPRSNGEPPAGSGAPENSGSPAGSAAPEDSGSPAENESAADSAPMDAAKAAPSRPIEVREVSS